MKNILLLGGSGFIGKEILQALLEAGHRVVATEHNNKIGLQAQNLSIIHTSFRDLDLAGLPFQPDIIVHAARNRTGRFGKFGRFFMGHKGKKENQALLGDIKKQQKPVKFIYISGSLMYGSHPGKLIDESFPTAPVSYAREYIHAEIPFLEEIKKNNNNVVMLRVPWVVGNGSWLKWAYTDYRQKHNTIPLYGEGSNKMTFVDVQYVAKSVCTLISTDFHGLLNLYHPQYLSQAEWAQLLTDETGSPLQKITTADPGKSAFTEAFHTDICLSSRHTDLQTILQKDMVPIRDIVRKYLPFML